MRPSHTALPDWLAKQIRSTHRRRQDSWTAVDASPMTMMALTSRQVLTLTPECTLQRATELLLRSGVSAAPVLNAERRPVGIVSKTDLLLAWRNLDDTTCDTPQSTSETDSWGLGYGFHIETPIDVSVADVMMPYVIAVKATDPLELGANLMAYEGVSQLLVLNPDHSFCGIVTALDISRWVAQLSGFCAEEREELQGVSGRNPVFA